MAGPTAILSGKPPPESAMTTTTASSPPDDRDAAFAEEEAKLAEVLLAIEEQSQETESLTPATAAYQGTADLAQTELNRLGISLFEALEQPYFARLDYTVIDAPRPKFGESEKWLGYKRIYIGSTPVKNQEVFSWESKLARVFYTGALEYTGAAGKFQIQTELKRHLQISNRKLFKVEDVYRRALNEALSRVGDTALDVIIATIQPEQYEIIANWEDPVIIVQGAAGSGKSVIGLHRLAYVLSPNNERGEDERPKPDTTLFIGLSETFLADASKVLPRLGFRWGVTQNTLHNWMGNQRAVKVRFQPRLRDHLLAQGELTLYSQEAEAFKGSLEMASILEQYVVERSKRIEVQCKSALIKEAGEELERLRMLSRAEVQNALDTAFAPSAHASPLNKRRMDFINSVASTAKAKINTRYVDERREAERQAEAWCRRVWPRLNAREEYLALLSDPESLARFSPKRITEVLIDELVESADRASRSGLLDSDEGALTYLDHLLNGKIKPNYHHIVVDEAQDISPIEFKLLSAASANKWFTVMGDLAQRLVPYKGIRRWGDVIRALGTTEANVLQRPVSYRSHKQITRFNNRILRLYEKRVDAPAPFGREGHRPEYHRHASREGMYAEVISELDRIRSLDGMQGAGIAILVRDQTNLGGFRKFCKANGVRGILEVREKGKPGTGAVLALIPDVRGLEYDAVIVMGVNETFKDTPFNQKLLYIACTRAKHYLALHWFGQQSPILRSVYSGGVRRFDHRRRK